MLNRVVFVAMLFVALTLTAFARAPQSNPGRVTGHLADATGTPVRGATVILSTPEGRTVGITIATDNGDYSFAAMPPGNYVVQVFAVGFGPSRLLNVKLDSGKDIKQDVAMDIGFVRNTPAPAGLRGALGSAPGAITMSSPNGVPRLRLGGNVAQANLVRQSAPLYPTDARDARIQGVVLLEAVIGVDGVVIDAKPINGPPPLIQAAVDAVKTWRYKPVVVNGAPTEVVTTITVNFAIK